MTLSAPVDYCVPRCTTPDETTEDTVITLLTIKISDGFVMLVNDRGYVVLRESYSTKDELKAAITWMTDQTVDAL